MLFSANKTRILRAAERADAIELERYKAEFKLEGDVKLKLFEIAAKTRMDEIGLFLSRSNYFLVLQTALAIAVFSGKIIVPAVVFTLALFGFIASILWIFAGLSSKYWQSRWEDTVSQLETKLFGTSFKLFNAEDSDNLKGVERSIGSHKLGHGRLRKFHNRMVLWKPSVTFAMFMLSVAFGIAWSVVVVHCVSLNKTVCDSYDAKNTSHTCFTKITKD